MHFIILVALNKMFVLNLLWLMILLISQISCDLLVDLKELLTSSDHEIINLLPTFLVNEALVNENNNRVKEMSLEFSAFGRPISLKLNENNLVSPKFKTYIYDENTTLLPYQEKNCHFLHRDSSIVAAISNCRPNSINGFIFLENTTLEINPLPDQFEAPLPQGLNDPQTKRIPHVIKRTSNSVKFDDDAFNFDDSLGRYKIFPKRGNNKRQRSVSNLTLEVALFFDEAAYKIFSPYMSYNDENLRDMLLAYLNAVQALYKHPSIGNTLDIILVRMDIMKVQPTGLPHYEGERSKLLDSFCEYQDEINPKGDENDQHWDMGLYVSGLDFFAFENGRKSGVTMGLATVGGVCYGRYACIIAEFGTTNMFGKPYPSAGFTSVYILAHEIGHSLGMHHDGSGNSCSKEGYIMSPSRGTQGETQWSTCSAKVMLDLSWATCLQDKGNQQKNLDHSRFMETPGRSYTAKKQCELLLRDKDAYVVPEDDLSLTCYSLRCKTPHRSGYYFAGPALEGTQCGKQLYCYGGDCVKRSPKPVSTVPGGWGPWKTSKCKSECLEKSKGFQIKERKCNNPLPINTDKGCEGPSYQHVLCKVSKACESKSKTPSEYASEKCKTFAEKLSDLDPKGAGLQSTHENNRLWMGCAIFCRRREGTYYTPRIELNDLGFDPYFPDGSWCHNENGQDYYCIHHHCLPENFEFSKDWFLDSWYDDLDFPQNALPYGIVPSALKPYLSLGSNGKPLEIDSNFHINLPKEEEWETDDYILLPDNLNEIN